MSLNSDPIFLSPPYFGEYAVEFKRDLSKGIRLFNAPSQEGLKFIVMEIVHKEQGVLWESAKEMLTQAVKMAESMLTGIYEYQVLFVGDLKKYAGFNLRNLAMLFVNHSKGLEPGSAVAVPYLGSMIKIKKLVPQNWGKIRFSHGVTVFSKEHAQLDLVFKKLLGHCSDIEGVVNVIVTDLSAEPIFRFGHEEQTERLRNLLDKNTTLFGEKVKSVMVINSGKEIDLLSQFGFEIKG